MKLPSRRDLLKTGLLVPAAAFSADFGRMARAVELTDELAVSQTSSEHDGHTANGSGRVRLLFDFGWRFHFGDADDPAKDFDFGKGSFQKTGNFLSASSLAFDDANWTPIDLPHDWAVELPIQHDPSLTGKGFFPLGRHYPSTSIGWYRRVFDLAAEDDGKRITIEFDGAYRQAIVILNGFYIGQHSGGYDPFSFNVTDFANPGGSNVLLVRVDATASDGWFYEGAGIYRHVWLVKTHPIHVKKWGTFVTSNVQSDRGMLSVSTEVNNHGRIAQGVQVSSIVIDPFGKIAGKAVSASQAIPQQGEHTYLQDITVRDPLLWSLENRNLYKLLTEVRVDGLVVDSYETPFGIRTVKFDSQKGLFLNGEAVKVKGTCNHQDHAGLGAALPDAVQYYRVRRLQEMGCNALRTSHNPPTPELLDACDRLGMLVLDETRMMSSNPEGLSQFADLVRRDRNHPSVFMWSMGNEEQVANTERGVAILTAMKRVADELDGSRPVTIAPIHAIGTGGLAICDVIGYNYMDRQAAAYHATHPERPVIGTETVSAVGTRGVYITDPSKGHVASYDPYTTTGRASAEGWWRFCESQPWLAGGFVWTGFDYRGEPSPYGWPNVVSQYGIIDLCGFPKDTFYYYQSWWTNKPVLHVFPHWNWPGFEGKAIAVWVHTNMDQVELLLNGRSFGTKNVQKNSHVAWDVKYAPGVIEARGYKNGKQVMIAKRETTGPAAKLMIQLDRQEVAADGEDVVMVAVEVQDAQGRQVPVADNEVAFTVVGEGKLIGLGNGDPTDHESDKGTSRKAFSGLCMAIVQSTKSSGEIRVEAASPGLASAQVMIVAKGVELRPQVPKWKRVFPAGEGVTGLWRPTVQRAGIGNMILTLQQSGSNLTGKLESGISDSAALIVNGTVEGSHVGFEVGDETYSGRIDGEQIILQRTPTVPQPVWAAASPIMPGVAIGPPPDGSDPSRGLSRQQPGSISITLRRVEH